jgi:uncharacterized protein (TIGR02265 family)
VIRIKGSVLTARLALVDQLAKSGGRERLMAALPEADRATLRSLLPSAWYPFELGKRLDEAIVSAIGGGRTDFFERIGQASAQENLTGVHRSFLVPGDPQGFLAQTSMIYSFYYDQGRREYEKTGPREAVLTTYDAEVFSEADCATIIGWHRRALEMCGATNPRVVEEECRARGAKVCRYRVSWD